MCTNSLLILSENGLNTIKKLRQVLVEIKEFLEVNLWLDEINNQETDQ